MLYYGYDGQRQKSNFKSNVTYYSKSNQNI